MAPRRGARGESGEAALMSIYVDDDREMPRFRVSRRAMTDPEVFARERAEIFDKVWLYVGHETELKKRGDFKTRRVAGRPVIFTRDAKGVVRVWINSCPHRGAMLCREGRGNARFMTCFYHGWSFSTSGQMVSMPDDGSYGADFERPGLASPAHVDSYRGFVFVSFNPDVEELSSYLAGAKEYLDLVADQSEVGMEVLEGTHEYSVRANWKLLVENSVDGYHAVSTHQRYFEMVNAAYGGVNQLSQRRSSRCVELGNGHSVIGSGAGGGAIFGRPLSPEAQAERDARFARLGQKYGQQWINRLSGSRNMVIFPNLVVIDLVMGVVIRKIDPVAEDYMEVTAWELAPPDEGAELKRQRLDNFLTFWGPGGLASPDDVEALETCQRSFAAVKELAYSDISRGMNKDAPSGSDELQMRLFWRRWNELVTGEQLPPEPHAALDDFFRAQRRPQDIEPAAAGS
jgi:benzoate/toluate 1,2-dioxygenase alpha subunit